MSSVNRDLDTRSAKSFAFAGVPSCTDPMTSPEIAPITRFLPAHHRPFWRCSRNRDKTLLSAFFETSPAFVSVYNLKPYIRMARSIQGTPAREVVTGDLSSCVRYQLRIVLQVLSKQPHCFSKRTNVAVWVLPSGRKGDGLSAVR